VALEVLLSSAPEVWEVFIPWEPSEEMAVGTAAVVAELQMHLAKYRDMLAETEPAELF
jgi:hypothetical protein